ncbi:MAG: hypothetical protein R3240_00515 [Gammaproteobacteria bacterium]|nr:hypothetical protein [Gammaproteobacteria bacterium]
MCISISLFTLTACGGGSDPLELAPERPFGKVNVQVFTDSLADPEIEAYSLGTPEERKFLGKGTLTESGNFELAIQAPSQLILLELSAKSYLEPSSNLPINIAENQKIKTYLYYQSGENQQVVVTPLNQLASGLVEFNLMQGQQAETALTDAESEISQLYTIPISSTKPAGIASLNDEQTASEKELYYGLLLAGLSQLSRNISQANEPNLYETLNTWTLAQLLYTDIKSDGKLDGRILDANNEEKLISFGDASIDANLLQQQLAAAILNTNLYIQNKQNLDLNKLADFIFSFSTAESDLFTGQAPEPLNKPLINLQNAPDTYYAGNIAISANVSGILKLGNIQFYLDHELLDSSANRFNGNTSINSVLYSDGQHTLTIIAIDEFGNEGTFSLTFYFDNTSPSIEILSNNISNKSTYRLQGQYTEGGSGIKEILVNQEKAVIDSDNNWFIDLQLSEGKNNIQIDVIDSLGNLLTQNHEIILDTHAPIIDTQGKHSEASFIVQNNSYIIGKLENSNNLPIYLTSDKLALNGEPILSSTLQDKNIPYFSFKVEDPISENQASHFENLATKIRIEKNGTISRDWFSIDDEQQEYYLPITQEILGSDLSKANINDKYVIRIKTADEAGNQDEAKLEFSVAVLPPTQDIVLVDPELGAAWQSIDFANRNQLFNQELATVRYEYTNNTVSSLYLKPREIGENQVTQEYELVERENKMRLKSTPFWRIGKVDNPMKTCPGFDGNWMDVTQIYNYVGEGIWQVETPQVHISDLIPIDSNILPTKEDSVWLDLSDFDNTYAIQEINTINGDKLSYKYDYVVDTGISGMSQPAFLTDWKSYTSNDNKTVICNDVRNIQYMEKYQYLQEPGFPRNNITEHQVEMDFATTFFKVYDQDGSTITAKNGWYQVAPGNKITIEKFVKTADLPSHNESIVATANEIVDYAPHTLDSKITWLISQSIGLQFALDLSNTLNKQVLSIDTEFNKALSQFSLSRD